MFLRLPSCKCLTWSIRCEYLKVTGVLQRNHRGCRSDDISYSALRRQQRHLLEGGAVVHLHVSNCSNLMYSVVAEIDTVHAKITSRSSSAPCQQSPPSQEARHHYRVGSPACVPAFPDPNPDYRSCSPTPTHHITPEQGHGLRVTVSSPAKIRERASTSRFPRVDTKGTTSSDW